MLNAIVARSTTPPWGETLALARALLAFSTIIPLATTSPRNLFLQETARDAPCSSLPVPNLFCALEPSQYWIGSSICLAVLSLVIVGLLPQVTCWAHAYVAYCFATAVAAPVGGDQIAQNLTLLLIPICVTWPATSMWKQVRRRPATGWREVIAWSSLFVIGVQAVTVYAVAFMSKLAVLEWRDGTALYYWFGDPMFGPVGWTGDVLRSLTALPWFLGFTTFGTLAIEAILALAFLYSRRGKINAFYLGVAFHGVIALAMGLHSFSLAMLALLILYLRDPHQSIVETVDGHTHASDTVQQRVDRLTRIKDGLSRKYGKA